MAYPTQQLGILRGVSTAALVTWLTPLRLYRTFAELMINTVIWAKYPEYINIVNPCAPLPYVVMLCIDDAPQMVRSHPLAARQQTVAMDAKVC